MAGKSKIYVVLGIPDHSWVKDMFDLAHEAKLLVIVPDWPDLTQTHEALPERLGRDWSNLVRDLEQTTSLRRQPKIRDWEQRKRRRPRRR